MCIFYFHAKLCVTLELKTPQFEPTIIFLLYENHLLRLSLKQIGRKKLLRSKAIERKWHWQIEISSLFLRCMKFHSSLQNWTCACLHAHFARLSQIYLPHFEDTTNCLLKLNISYAILTTNTLSLLAFKFCSLKICICGCLIWKWPLSRDYFLMNLNLF